MLILKNVSRGPRLVLMKTGKYERLMVNETRTIDGELANGIPDGLIEIPLEPAEDQGSVPDQPEGLDQQLKQSEGTGEPMQAIPAEVGGELTQLDPEPPQFELKQRDMSKMSRATLEALARTYGIDLNAIKGTGKKGAVLMPDIRKAIEAKRASTSA